MLRDSKQDAASSRVSPQAPALESFIDSLSQPVSFAPCIRDLTSASKL